MVMLLESYCFSMTSDVHIHNTAFGRLKADIGCTQATFNNNYEKRPFQFWMIVYNLEEGSTYVYIKARLLPLFHFFEGKIFKKD